MTESSLRQPEPEVIDQSWSGRLRVSVLKVLPPEKLLPKSQPSYVATWIYVFGMGAIASLVFIIGSGVVLSFNGPMWWHLSSLGQFLNSVHLWSVEFFFFFFFFMVIHLWGQVTTEKPQRGSISRRGAKPTTLAMAKRCCASRRVPMCTARSATMELSPGRI